jgi:hypothetical protein
MINQLQVGKLYKLKSTTTISTQLKQFILFKNEIVLLLEINNNKIKILTHKGVIGWLNHYSLTLLIPAESAQST